MNDADILRELEDQSIAMTQTLDPNNPSGQQNFATPTQGSHSNAAGPADVEPQKPNLEPSVTTTVQGRPATLSDSPKIESRKEVFSYPCDPYELRDCKIPNYRLASNCTSCAYSVYDPVRYEATCCYWKCSTVAGYVCDKYLDPCSLAASSLSDSSPSPQENLADPPKKSLFADPALYRKARKAAVKEGLKLGTSESAAILLSRYRALYAQKYGAEANPFVAP